MGPRLHVGHRYLSIIDDIEILLAVLPIVHSPGAGICAVSTYSYFNTASVYHLVHSNIYL